MWWHEIRRGGRVVLSLPVIAGLAVDLFVGPVGGFAARALVGYVIPIVAGFAAAAIVAGETMAELHLTVPTPYQLTLARRLGLLVLTTQVGTALAVGGSAWLGAVPHPVAVGVAVTGFNVAMIGLATVAVVAMRSAAGASAVVFAGWLAKILLVDQAVRSGAMQGVLLAAAAVACCLTTVRLLRDDDRLQLEAR